MELPRRSSLRSNSICKKDETIGVKFPPLPNAPDVPKYEIGSSGLQSSRNSINESRRNSVFRRGSIIQEPNSQHSVTFAIKSEGDILKNCVPLTSVPRFSCELFDEGRFTTFKGYEYLLRKQIEENNPEYRTILNESQPSPYKIVLNKEALRQKVALSETEFQMILHSKGEKRRQRAKYNPNDSTNSENNQTDDMEKEKIKLLMSRHLQFAQLLLDSLKSGSVVRSNKYVGKLPPKNFNVIQAFNWWNSTWQNFFITYNQPNIEA